VRIALAATFAARSQADRSEVSKSAHQTGRWSGNEGLLMGSARDDPERLQRVVERIRFAGRMRDVAERVDAQLMHID
jgi:hypothetical protein